MARDSSGLQSVSARLAVGAPVKERADAARNRRRVLDAAAALFAARGVSGVSMDEVAAEAGVGKGTLFRRFGDKAGLAAALLDDRERELQQAVLDGAAPLGPGAAPAQRLQAFLAAYLDYCETHLDLVRMSETAAPGARYRIGAYLFWHRHLTVLLTAARTPAGPSAEALAHVLLAPLAADVLAGLGPEAWPAHRTAVLAVATAVAGAPDPATTSP
ncbi:MAG TPA: TetR/AcrR family transcriptional regulator [Kineosporiaceae bacterium]|nr:TetR/AcrR family transcriptional regulator [Kineosporiaceae bacterium]